MSQTKMLDLQLVYWFTSQQSSALFGKLCFSVSFFFKNIVQEDVLKSILYASHTPGPGVTDTLFHWWVFLHPRSWSCGRTVSLVGLPPRQFHKPSPSICFSLSASCPTPRFHSWCCFPSGAGYRHQVFWDLEWPFRKGFHVWRLLSLW